MFFTMRTPAEQERDRPHSEPEIIPPGRDDLGAGYGRSRIWVSISSPGGHRAYIAHPGLFAVALTFLAGLLGIALLLVGAFLAVVAVGAFVLIGVARAFLRRPGSMG